MSLPHDNMTEPVFPCDTSGCEELAVSVVGEGNERLACDGCAPVAVTILPPLTELERQVKAMRAEFDAHGPRSPEFRRMLLALLDGETS